MDFDAVTERDAILERGRTAGARAFELVAKLPVTWPEDPFARAAANLASASATTGSRIHELHGARVVRGNDKAAREGVDGE
jgi:hypothetical protein